jgi:hypothetical protein
MTDPGRLKILETPAGGGSPVWRYTGYGLSGFSGYSGLISKYNAFVFTLLATNTTVAVTFPIAFAGGVTPVVVCTPSYQTSFWVTSISNTGFTFNVGTADSTYNQSINCIATSPIS